MGIIFKDKEATCLRFVEMYFILIGTNNEQLLGIDNGQETTNGGYLLIVL